MAKPVTNFIIPKCTMLAHLSLNLDKIIDENLVV